MRYQYMTGFDEDEIDGFVARIKTIAFETGKPLPTVGRRSGLTLHDLVAITLTLDRLGITQELAASMWGVSQPTISVINSAIEPLLDQALTLTGPSLGEAVEGRVALVDGTYVPTGNRKATGRRNYSGKRHVQCLSIQVACDTSGALLAVSDPVPGARHDSAALELCGWDIILKDADWIADTAYTAHGAVTPLKKPIGRQLAESEKEYNKSVSHLRCAVERCISHLKNWRILSKGYRRQLKRLPFVIALIVKLELHRIGW